MGMGYNKKIYREDLEKVRLEYQLDDVEDDKEAITFRNKNQDASRTDDGSDNTSTQLGSSWHKSFVSKLSAYQGALSSSKNISK
jgi:hypothetical protein